MRNFLDTTGKTYLACALGMEACKQFFGVKFVRTPYVIVFGRIKNEMFYNRSWADVTMESFMETLDAYVSRSGSLLLASL